MMQPDSISAPTVCQAKYFSLLCTFCLTIINSVMVVCRYDNDIMVSNDTPYTRVPIVIHPWLLNGQQVLKTMRSAASSRRCSGSSRELNQTGSSTAQTGRTRTARHRHAGALPGEGRDRIMLESLVRLLRRRINDPASCSSFSATTGESEPLKQGGSDGSPAGGGAKPR